MQFWSLNNNITQNMTENVISLHSLISQRHNTSDVHIQQQNYDLPELEINFLLLKISQSAKTRVKLKRQYDKEFHWA